MKRDFPTADEWMLELDREDARQKEKLRQFLLRERARPRLSLGWRFLIAFCCVALAAALLYWYIVAPALAALTGEN